MSEEKQSDNPRDEMNLICRDAADMAFGLLEQNGSLIPFGLAVSTEGQLEMVAPSEDKISGSSDDALEDVRSTLRSGADEHRYRATAIVSDVRIETAESEEKSDALRVDLEHMDDSPISCFLLYTRVDGKLDHGESHMAAGKAIVFPKE